MSLQSHSPEDHDSKGGLPGGPQSPVHLLSPRKLLPVGEAHVAGATRIQGCQGCDRELRGAVPAGPVRFAEEGPGGRLHLGCRPRRRITGGFRLG